MANKHNANDLPKHLQFSTKFTREGERDYTNRKPYRTAALKAQARRQAQQGKDGVWRSPVRVMYHEA